MMTAFTINVPSREVSFFKNESAAMKNTTVAKKVTVTKFIKNGRLVIEKNGKLYNATGVEVK